jgi:hypothetical protein
MAPNGESASETSPLLGQILDNGSTTNSSNNKSAPVECGLTTDSVDAPGDLERRGSVDESRAAQFQGAPEIQKKLSYILPALSIGVGRKNLPFFLKTAIRGLST